MIPDRLHSTLEYLERLWREVHWNALNDAIDALGYNDAGLICAQIRASGDADLASHIEKRRFK